ncbi:hypothetical protein [Streptomyces sp. NPDC057287]|uniref:hypothetical protein n=1 Tax=Streptomyces sp. NPDC057287 TaxID=3346086 RepID=UPI0036328776
MGSLRRTVRFFFRLCLPRETGGVIYWAPSCGCTGDSEGSGVTGGLSSAGGSGLADADGSPDGVVVAERPGAAGAEDAFSRGGLTDAEAEALAPRADGTDSDAPRDGVAEAAPGTGAEALGVAPGPADTTSPPGAGRTSTSSARFSSCPESGSQGAAEFPPSTATTSVTAYTAQIVASTQPTRRYVLLRRPLSSTNTGPSDGSGGLASTGNSEI